MAEPTRIVDASGMEWLIKVSHVAGTAREATLVRPPEVPVTPEEDEAFAELEAQQNAREPNEDDRKFGPGARPYGTIAGDYLKSALVASRERASKEFEESLRARIAELDAREDYAVLHGEPAELPYKALMLTGITVQSGPNPSVKLCKGEQVEVVERLWSREPAGRSLFNHRQVLTVRAKGGQIVWVRGDQVSQPIIQPTPIIESLPRRTPYVGRLKVPVIRYGMLFAREGDLVDVLKRPWPGSDEVHCRHRHSGYCAMLPESDIEVVR